MRAARELAAAPAAGSAAAPPALDLVGWAAHPLSEQADARDALQRWLHALLSELVRTASAATPPTLAAVQQLLEERFLCAEGAEPLLVVPALLAAAAAARDPRAWIGVAAATILPGYAAAGGGSGDDEDDDEAPASGAASQGCECTAAEAGFVGWLWRLVQHAVERHGAAPEGGAAAEAALADAAVHHARCVLVRVRRRLADPLPPAAAGLARAVEVMRREAELVT